MTPQPKLTLNLQADRHCFLNQDQESSFNLVIHLTLTSEQPITLIRSSHHNKDELGLRELLVCQCIECIDVETGLGVPVLESGQASQSIIDSGVIGLPQMTTLEPERSNYMTFTTASNPREYEYVFSPRALEPDRTYKIECKPAALRWWTHDSQEAVGEYFHTHRKVPPPETPPLQCEPLSNNNNNNDAITFSIRSELPPAPSVSITLSAPSTISLTSNPPFTFSLTFTSHASIPITILSTPPSTIATNTDIEILSATTRTRLAPDIIDSGNDDGPWLREDFLRLQPGVPYIEHRTLDPAGAYSGLEGLQVGGEYVLRMVEGEWGWWSFDDVDTVLGYAGERGEGRLGPARAIRLVCGEEVRFRGVA